MAVDSTPAGNLRFGVDARHIRQLGQELVGDRITAISELVKNSYDADAARVTLRFLDAADTNGTLEIEDDGEGMNLAALGDGWMQISTAGKEKQSISTRYRRTRAGRKGIGRFATETLGRHLTLSTTCAGSPERLVVQFDWTRDYTAGLDLTTIENPYFIEETAEDEHGTLLRIEGLYDRWEETQRSRINKAVRLLQPPFPITPSAAFEDTDGRTEGEPDPGFSVTVVVDGAVETQAADGYDEFLAAATAQLVAVVSDDGLVMVHITSKLLGIDVEQELPERYPGAGAFSVQASYFIFTKDTLGSVSRTLAQAMAEQYAGVRVYRDGLRVMPYGERDNDWLGLDELSASRSVLLVPVANRNWFGQIEISRVQNPGLRDTASREGLVVDEAFVAMRAAARAALEATAVEVSVVRGRKAKASRRVQPTRKEILEQARDDIATAAREELSPAVAAQIEDVVSRVLDVAVSDASAGDDGERERVESLLGELELLRILASLGTSIAVFSHEVRAALNATSAALAVLAEQDPRDSTHLNEAQRALGDLTELAGYIDAYVSLSRRRERVPQPLQAVLSDFVAKLSRNVARNVDFDVDVKPISLRTEPMGRSELESALINLLTNAVKAMDAEGKARRIAIKAFGEGTQVVLRFQDTGAGVKPAIAERIFDAFVTDSRPEVSELGSGTGLGLKIVSDIAEANGGSIALATPDEPYRTCFELRLPRWAEQVTDP